MVASTNLAGRCHCMDLPDPKPLRFNRKDHSIRHSRKGNMRTKTAEWIPIGELRPIFHRHRRAIPTGGEASGRFGWLVTPSVSSSIVVVVSTSTDGRVVLGLDDRKVNRQDHGKHDGHDSSGHNKPEYGPFEQRSTPIGLRFDILFKILPSFGDQRCCPRRGQGISKRYSRGRAVRQEGRRRLKRSIIVARYADQSLVRRGRRGRWDALLGGRSGGHEGRGDRQRRPPKGSPLFYVNAHR